MLGYYSILHFGIAYIIILGLHAIQLGVNTLQNAI